MPNALVQPLFNGPVDVVGDVHGEIQALKALMEHLEYREDGTHPDGRRLVFLGDLTDRGPDSPAVVRLVQRLVENGRAQCVLGNHDLNILLDEKKFDNGWFFGQEFKDEHQKVVEQMLLKERAPRRQVHVFFRSLPLVLERPDLRVVHACWRTEMVDVARQADDVLELYRRYADLIEQNNDARPGLDGVGLELDLQNRNPVKVLTSGLERRAKEPFWAGGKLRQVERVDWWKDYADPEYCVFGHYGIPPGKPHGQGQALCVDYAVGKRWTERPTAGFAGPFKAKLAAARFPEKSIHFDDGTTERITA